MRLGIAVSLLIFGVVHLFAENCDSLSDIQGMTSASQRLKIRNGYACETYVDITWWDSYSNGSEHTLKYGKTQAMGEEINLKPFSKKTNITTRIKDLEPNTTYYAQFYRKYKSRIKKLDFTFKTLEPVSSIHLNKNRIPKQGISLRMTGSVLHIQNYGIAAQYMVLFNMQGKSLLKQPINGSHISINLSKLAKGMYQMSFQRDGRTVKNKRVLIGY